MYLYISGTHHMTSTILEMAILSPSEEILDKFGKTFLFESSHRPTELFEETFKSVDKQSLVLCVNLQGKILNITNGPTYLSTLRAHFNAFVIKPPFSLKLVCLQLPCFNVLGN